MHGILEGRMLDGDKNAKNDKVSWKEFNLIFKLMWEWLISLIKLWNNIDLNFIWLNHSI